jgi:hypothetical protein
MTPARCGIVGLLALAACQRGEVPPTHEDLAIPPAPAVSLPLAVSSVEPTSPTASAEPAVEPCTAGQRVAPDVLAISWPQRIGQRVRLRSNIERSLDLLEAVVAAGGKRFVVVLGPDQLWSGDQEHTFTVMGAKAVALHGTVTLPQLLLDEECSP